ncbi:MAG: helix-turn-helix transcriptional regulator [Verrucomicrobia bacterium]|nr:helix-turn-helix transcriptional regulator [Verrucomicrobiota bacterium]MDA1007011.1 helix-turn-helix transcriptional regulator [Verrucomicrobiota bacterium]
MKATFKYGSPQRLAVELGQRLRRMRMERGWTQEEVAERSGIGLSSLKSLEGSGKGTLVRFLQVASVLGAMDECAMLFAQSRVMESLEAVARAERQRAPRRKKRGEEG